MIENKRSSETAKPSTSSGAGNKPGSDANQAENQSAPVRTAADKSGAKSAPPKSAPAKKSVAKRARPQGRGEESEALRRFPTRRVWPD